jgi:hypothetical protein
MAVSGNNDIRHRDVPASSEGVSRRSMKQAKTALFAPRA